MSEAFNFAKEPLSIGGVLDAGIRGMRSTFKQILPTAAVAAIPYTVLLGMMGLQTGALESEEDPEVLMAAAMDTFMLMPFLYLALTFLIATVAFKQARLMRGGSSRLSEDLMIGLKRMLPLTILMVAFAVVVTVGMVLLIVPGIILMVNMSLFMYVSFMEEERSVWSGLGRSNALVWGGNWWRTLTVITVASIIGMVLALVFYMGLGALAFVWAEDGPTTLFFLMEGVLNWALMLVYMPFFVAISLALYNDLLIRKEGGDLETRLGELQA
jgi:hypothetical protein